MKLKALFAIVYIVSADVTVRATQHFFTKEQLSEFCMGVESGNDTELIQIKAVRQSSAKADCAYHALRNGCLIALSVVDPEHNYFEKLHDTKHMKASFDRWLPYIIKERIMLIARKIICEKLMQSFKGASIIDKSRLEEGFPFNDNQKLAITPKQLEQWDEQELAKVINAVKNVTCRFKPEIENEGLHYTFDSQNFYNELLKNIPGDVAQFDKYFVRIDEDFTITWDGKLLQNGKKVNHGHKGRPLDGQWLEMNEEVPLLLRMEEENGLLAKYEIDTALYTGIQEPVFKQMTKEACTKRKSELVDVQLLADFKLMRGKIQNKEEFVGLILVYLGGDASLEHDESLLKFTHRFHSKTNNGHWVSMVVISQKGKRQYVVADSLHGNMLTHPTIYQVMRLLEGDENSLIKKKKFSFRSANLQKRADCEETSFMQLLKNNEKKESASSSWSLFSWKSMLSLGAAATAAWYAYRSCFSY